MHCFRGRSGGLVSGCCSALSRCRVCFRFVRLLFCLSLPVAVCSLPVCLYVFCSVLSVWFVAVFCLVCLVLLSVVCLLVVVWFPLVSWCVLGGRVLVVPLRASVFCFVRWTSWLGETPRVTPTECPRFGGLAAHELLARLCI